MSNKIYKCFPWRHRTHIRPKLGVSESYDILVVCRRVYALYHKFTWSSIFQFSRMGFMIPRKIDFPRYEEGLYNPCQSSIFLEQGCRVRTVFFFSHGLGLRKYNSPATMREAGHYNSQAMMWKKNITILKQ